MYIYIYICKYVSLSTHTHPVPVLLCLRHCSVLEVGWHMRMHFLPFRNVQNLFSLPPSELCACTAVLKCLSSEDQKGRLQIEYPVNQLGRKMSYFY